MAEAFCAEATQGLIDEIIETEADGHDASVYDTLRCARYRGRQELAAAYDKITSLLKPQVCNCPNRVRVLNRINAAWSHVNTSEAEDEYNNGPEGRLFLPPPRYEIKSRQPIESVSHAQYGVTWNHDFRDVEGCPALLWTKLDFCNYFDQAGTTFWEALASELENGTWAEVKAGTENYYKAVMNDQQHPRRQVYESLQANLELRRNSSSYLPPWGLDDMDRQLGRGLSVRVSPELWQVVADAWRIELLIILEPKYKLKGTATAVRPIMARGDPRGRQVFLLQTEIGEYILVHPKLYRADVAVAWRYKWHLPKTYTGLRKPDDEEAYRQTVEALNARRSPWVQIDQLGLPLQPITATTHMDAYQEIRPLNPIMREPYHAVATTEQIDAHLHNGFYN